MEENEKMELLGHQEVQSHHHWEVIQSQEYCLEAATMIASYSHHSLMDPWMEAATMITFFSENSLMDPWR